MIRFLFSRVVVVVVCRGQRRRVWGGGVSHIDIHCSVVHLLYNWTNLCSVCQVCCNMKAKHITFKLLASCLLVNVNKAVSRQEMRRVREGESVKERERERTVEERRWGGRGGSWVRAHNYKSFISSENHKVSSQKGSWAQINFFQSITSTEVLTFICESNTPTVM